MSGGMMSGAEYPGTGGRSLELPRTAVCLARCANAVLSSSHLQPRRRTSDSGDAELPLDSNDITDSLSIARPMGDAVVLERDVRECAWSESCRFNKL
jgi:hypothetical protein